ncbi:MAG: tRNA (adenosine(37)-N6)-threonylcarbamoyltransferase complex ATPase subunit type 1 TsaE [Candidatus Roizmanbacteria bacterium]
MTLSHISDLSRASIPKIIETLRSGGLVVCPSDTVYGLLVDAKNDEAVHKLFAFKDRPVGKAISVFVSGLHMMSDVVDMSAMSPATRSLLPGPYTFVLPSLHHTSRLLESEKGSLGVRWIGRPLATSHKPQAKGISSSYLAALLSPQDFVTTLVEEYGSPITATSANVSGKSSCYSIDAFMHQLSDKKKQLIDLIVDGGELPRHEPSTVLDLTMPTPTVLRATSAGQTTITHSVEETMEVAETFISSLLGEGGPRLTRGKELMVYLHGDLGAGKTHFVKGIAKHFGFDRVVSPTYVGLQEYINDLISLYHVDLYNFQSAADVEALQLNRLLYPPNPVIPAYAGIQTKNEIPGPREVAFDATERGRQARNDSQERITIICIEWSEVGSFPHAGKHVFIEHQGRNERKITFL